MISEHGIIAHCTCDSTCVPSQVCDLRCCCDVNSDRQINDAIEYELLTANTKTLTYSEIARAKET